MRIAFFVDGFNLYHSVKDVISDGFGTAQLKWLDIPGLCEGIVRDCPDIPRTGVVESVTYFTALAKHMEARSPGIVKRHETFVSALKTMGATVHLAAFKRTANGRHEEKETDVAIAVALLETFHNDSADCAFVVSGDTDLMPAVRAAKRMFPGRQVCFAFPYRRQNNVLKDEADVTFRIRAHRYSKHLLPNPIVTAAGAELRCPAKWWGT